MTDEARRKLLILIPIGLITLLALGVYGFFTYLNFGTLSLKGKAPFNVEFFDGAQVKCENSPCDIKQKAGLNDFIITKQGHKTLVESTKVPIFRTVSLDLQFSILPFLAPTDSLPLIPKNQVYTLLPDQNRYALVKLNDPLATPLVYFNNQINDPQIVGSEESVLIIGTDKSYRIDLTLKKRTAVESNNFKRIQSASWSPHGEYLLFTTADSQYFQILMPDNSVKTLGLLKDITKAQFTSNDLLFITKQQTQELGETDSQGFYFTEMSSDQYEQGLIVGRYLLKSDRYISIKYFEEISELPETFIPTSNGRLIYFENKDGIFKISF